MKRKIMLVLIAICCTVSVTACAVQQQPSNASQNAVISESSVAGDLVDNSKPTLTKAQMLEDYDTMWSILEENYPHFGILSRKYVAEGLDANHHLTLKHQYREKIEGMTTEGDEAVVEFIGILDQCLTEVGHGTAHLRLIKPNEYPVFSAYREALQEIPEYEIWADTVENEKTVKMYEYYSSLIKSGTDNNAQTSDNTANQEQESAEPSQETQNLELSILEEGKAAYIKIRSFPLQNTEQAEQEIARILGFYNQIKDCPNLIIDITDNRGGDFRYCQESIVSPNITQDITIRSFPMLSSGALAIEFSGVFYKDSTLTIEDVRNNPANINLHKEDLEKLAQARYEDLVVKASGQDTLYKGKIWLLINNRVFSSGDTFSGFCKYTGFATLVGQTTEGDGWGGKDPIIGTLPNSHMLFRFSAEYSLNPDGSCNQEIGTVPDIKTDTPLETCLELIKQEAK